MKKLLLVAAAGFMIAGMSSCKKDYTCTCTTPETTVLGFTVPAQSASTTINDTKKNAEEACEAGTQSGVTCTIAE
ncbi:hypothetical protein N8085_01325 [Salibacteraceae bacterium]|nr:hypothetical protein [Salibacteraceae bacterium]